MTAHSDPVAPLLLSLAVIFIVSRLAGHVAVRLKQPAVLGELIVGVVLGNLSLLGYDGLESLKRDPFLEMLARLGVILLLFEVGLESTISQMLKVGLTAASVAALGVIAPFGLGWAVSSWLLPTAGSYVHAFIGATLSATSVGITARVLQDIGKSRTAEARIILGAAVIDDVLGLIILAVVSGVIAAAGAGEAFSLNHAGLILLKAAGFLTGALVLGVWLSPKLFSIASRLRAGMVLLAAGLSFCFLLAYLADLVGLAPIVGAFAAGLILEEVHYKSFIDRGEESLEHLIHPISSFLVPIFFVLMGMRTDLNAFVQPGVPVLAAALVIVAIAGKQACSLGVLQKGVNKIAVGIGMIPRGEVGLIFANIGLQLTISGKPVLDSSVFSAIVVMVIVTTLITPPALKWSLNRFHPDDSSA